MLSISSCQSFKIDLMQIVQTQSLQCRTPCLIICSLYAIRYDTIRLHIVSWVQILTSIVYRTYQNYNRSLRRAKNRPQSSDAPQLYHLRDIASCWSKIPKFLYPTFCPGMNSPPGVISRKLMMISKMREELWILTQEERRVSKILWSVVSKPAERWRRQQRLKKSVWSQ